MHTEKQHIRRFYASILQRFIVLLSLPLIASACQVSNRSNNDACIAQPDTQTIVSDDTIKIVKVYTISTINPDAIVPVYVTPIQITPCYSVVATPIFPTMNIPEY
jgi:hypothetical protein